MLNSCTNRLNYASAQLSIPFEITSPTRPNLSINQLLNTTQLYRSPACWYNKFYGNQGINCKGKLCPWSSLHNASQKRAVTHHKLGVWTLEKLNRINPLFFVTDKHTGAKFRST